MFNLELCTVESRIPVKDKIIENISERGFHFFETEGITNNNNNFTIFQRFKATNIDTIANEEIISKINELVDMRIYSSLKAKGLEVIFIVYEKECKNFLCYQYNNLNLDEIFQTNDCKTLAIDFFTKYVSVKKHSKPIKVPQNFTCIDICLRKHDIAYPGNFDGLILSSDNIPKLLIEFSKVKYATLEVHRSNLGYGRFFDEDKNRWKIFLETANFLNIPNLVIWWDYNNDNNFMTGYIDHIENKDGIIINDVISNKELISLVNSLL